MPEPVTDPATEPASEPLVPEAEVTRWRLVKTDVETGKVFEIVEGGKDRETVATFRRPGQPPESYAEVPYRPTQEESP